MGMGPFKVLMSLGANIIDIDLDRSGIWKNLITYARNSPGSITFPMKKAQSSCKDDDDLFANSGSNLFTETPLIKDWLLPLFPGKDLVVGSYAYLDGALHAQGSLAMDAICKALSEERKATLAYLCTPTDAHLCSKEASEASRREYNRMTVGRLFEGFWQIVSRGAFLKKNARKPLTSDDGEEFYLVDGLAVAQGPNYALAKRLQHWRAIVARESGHVASTMVAPSTATISVIHNKTFAWAYGGMPAFGFEIFKQETTNAVMSAVLLHDVMNGKGPKNPTNRRKFGVDNALKLFSSESVHGGLWRAPYTVDSLGEASAMIYFAGVAKPAILAAAF